MCCAPSLPLLSLSLLPSHCRPGDPTRCATTINELGKVIRADGDALRPVFGICLGNQLLGLAAGAQTIKLPFGNRGQNQPVVNKLTGEAYITPQVVEGDIRHDRPVTGAQ